MVKFLIADSSLQIRKWELFNQVSSGFLKPFEVALWWCVSSIQRASEDVTFFCIDGLGKNATCHDFGWPLDTAESWIMCSPKVSSHSRSGSRFLKEDSTDIPQFIPSTNIYWASTMWRVWTRHAKQGLGYRLWNYIIRAWVWILLLLCDFRQVT